MKRKTTSSFPDITKIARSVSGSSSASSSETCGLRLKSIVDDVCDLNEQRVDSAALPIIDQRVEYVPSKSGFAFRFNPPTSLGKLFVTLYHATGLDRRVFCLRPETVLQLTEALESKTPTKAIVETFLENDLIVTRSLNRVLVYVFEYLSVYQTMSAVNWRVPLERMKFFVHEETTEDQIASVKAMAFLLVNDIMRVDEKYAWSSATQLLIDRFTDSSRVSTTFPSWMGQPRRHVFLDAPDHWHAIIPETFHVVRRSHWTTLKDAERIVRSVTKPIVWLGRAALAEQGPLVVMRSMCVAPPAENEPSPKQKRKVRSVSEAVIELVKTKSSFVVVSSTDISYETKKRGVWYSLATGEGDTNKDRALKMCPPHYPHIAHFNSGSIDRFRSFKCAVDWIVYAGKLILDRDAALLEDACNVGLMIVQ